MEVVLLEIAIKKMRRTQLSGDELKPGEESAGYIYRASLAGQKVVLLNQYVQKMFPALYPLFEKTDSGALTIVGVRLHVGDKYRQLQVVFPNELYARHRMEGALTVSVASIQDEKSQVTEEIKTQ
jgi:hypothetical protein